VKLKNKPGLRTVTLIARKWLLEGHFPVVPETFTINSRTAKSSQIAWKRRCAASCL